MKLKIIRQKTNGKAQIQVGKQDAKIFEGKELNLDLN